MDIANRVVLITGGKRIGATVAIDLARRGASVIDFADAEAVGIGMLD